MLQRLLARQRGAELHARLQVLDGQLECELHRADRFRGERRDAGVHGRFDQRRGLARDADERVAVDADRLETNVRRTSPVVGAPGVARDAGTTRVDHEQREAVGVVHRTVDPRTHQQRIGAVAVQDRGLHAVDHPVLAFAPCAGRDVVEATGIRRLGMGPRQHPVAGHDGRHPARALRRARAAQRGRAEHQGRQERVERQRAAERLHHEHHVDRAAAQSAVGLGIREPEQPDAGRLPPQRAAEAVGLVRIRAPLLEAVLALHQAQHRILQHALVVVQGEVHVN